MFRDLKGSGKVKIVVVTGSAGLMIARADRNLYPVDDEAIIRPDKFCADAQPGFDRRR
jgi:hypothetical protein